MDVGRIDELMQYWCISLPRVQPFYALQCNSDPVLLHLLAHYPNFGFFCASGDDVEKVTIAAYSLLFCLLFLEFFLNDSLQFRH